jgi:single-strand DNA-binding protein
MTASNDVTIIGNITRDPELRFLTSGTALTNLGVACNRRYQKNNEWVEETSFFDCVVWRDQAENVAESLTKGDRVIISGRLEQRTWETDDGQKRSKVEIVVDEIGPSLRWALATPARQPSKGNGNGAAESTGSSSSEGFNYEDAEEPF